MKRIYIKTIMVLGILSALLSCKKFLDVKPEDKILEAQQFSSKSGINTALNGLYIALADSNLYGANLTMGFADVLAQRYNVPSTHNRWTVSSYAYTSNPAAGIVSNIWSRAYKVILNANAFTANLTTYAGVLDAHTDSIYRGEAIALRALVHFDLLRMFGPVYNTTDSTKTCIPYYTDVNSATNPLLAANKVMELISADLAKAETLLKNDPIITSGVIPNLLGDSGDFLRNRNFRLNYYAVKALQARINLYRGNKPAALAAAKVVIQKSSLFPWTTSANALTEKANPDRVFSTELILGIKNTQLYLSYQNNFSPDLTDANILAPLPARLAAVFESNANDYRYNLNWLVPTNGSKSYSTFYKYADVIDKTKAFRFNVPLIRVSEMYYIAAECETDLAQAYAYLNVVRNNRGLANLSLTTTTALTTELQKEYQKEFFGEGQLFFYYKRRNVTAIPNGSSTANIAMNAATYVLPLPVSETQYR